jgi:lactoylglutathione lyase
MSFCHSTLNVKNMEESLRFYQDIVGLKINRRFKAGPDIEIAFLGDGDTKVELICNGSEKMPNVGRDISWGFTVKSVDEMMALLKEKGIDILEGPMQPNPHTKFFFVLDPNGMKIQFVESL